MTVRLRPFDAGFLQDPYPTYAALREQEPVRRLRIGPLAIVGLLRRASRMRREMGQPGIVRTLVDARRRRARGEAVDPHLRLRRRLYLVSRYDDVSRVLRDSDLFSSAAMGGPRRSGDQANVDPTNGSLISLDPPEHGHHRAIVNRGFTPRRIADLEPRIRKVADELLGSFEARGHCDLVAEFSNPLPVAVIAELLGLDPARRDDFKRWSTALIIGSTQGGGPPRAELFREFRGYMSEVVEQRRREPGDDLISLLVHAEEESGILDTGQVVGFASLLLAAGSETTTNLIGNALLALHEHPEQAAALRANPSLIPQLLEEALRFDPPVQLLMRVATRDARIGKTPIPEGSFVIALLGAANRDPARFEDPERFDLQRNSQGHLGFGLGNHFCLGASLARLEARIALEMLFERLPDWRIDAERIERHGSFLIRGPRELPLRFGA